MKILLSFLFVLLSTMAFGQSVLPLRADTVLIEKSQGNGELKIKNSTRDTLGVMVNMGGGKTRFMRVRVLNDSTFIMPPSDTIVIRGRGLPVDVFLIAGQSNAQGFGVSGTSPVPAAGTVFQFYGETISAGSDPVGNANTGSSWPQFGITYHALTARKICFVPSAFSGSAQTVAATTSFGNWDTTGTHFDTSVARLNRSLVALSNAGYTPYFRGILWGQGENDANAINTATITQAAYLAALQKMIGRYRTAFGQRTPFYIFRTGTINGGSDVGYDSVRQAQLTVTNGDSLTSIVFYNARYFLARGLMPDTYHYTQPAYNEMGRIGAMNIVGVDGLSLQPQAGNVYIDVSNTGFGTGSPTARVHAVGTTTVPSALFSGGSVGINITTPLLPLHVNDSARVNNLTISRRGLSSNPSIATTTYLTFQNTNNIVINQGVGSGVPEHRLTGSASGVEIVASGVINGFNFNAGTVGSRQPLYITTSGLSMASNQRAGPIILRPGTNYASGILTQYGNDSVQVDLNGQGAFDVRGKAYIRDSLKVGNVPTGTGTDSVLVINANLIYKVLRSSFASSLTTNYIGYGIGGLLSGTSDFQYNGTQQTIETSGARLQVNNTAALGGTSGGYTGLFATTIPSSSQRLGILTFGSTNSGASDYAQASIAGFAGGAWTAGSSHNTQLNFYTTPSGSITMTERMRILGNGHILMNTTTDVAGIILQVNGGSGKGIVANTTTDNAVEGIATNGTGVTGASTGGVGVFGQSANNVAGVFYVLPGTGNTETTALQLTSAPTVSASDGTAVRVDLYNKNASGSVVRSHRLVSILNDATGGLETSQFVFRGLNSGVEDDLLTINGNGYVTLNRYPFLTPSSDTTTYGPIGYNRSNGDLVPMASWVGSGADLFEFNNYAPTLTNTANLSASSATDGLNYEWNKITNVIKIWGYVTVDPSLTATSTSLGISLPTSSTFSNIGVASGTAFASGIAGQGAAIRADVANNRLEMIWVATDISSQPMHLTVMLKVTPP